MAEYPYTIKTGSLKKFFEKIQSAGVPDKVTQTLLYTLGFKSTNDRKVVPVLKFIKFIDNNGTPTEYYKHYRDTSKSSQVLARAIRESYSELFKVYPDAEKQDNTTLRNFFSTHTKLGEKAIKSTVETFKALCSLAKFNGEQTKINLDDKEGIEDTESINDNSINKFELSLASGKKAKIFIPKDIKKEEVEKLKNLLDILT